MESIIEQNINIVCRWCGLHAVVRGPEVSPPAGGAAGPGRTLCPQESRILQRQEAQARSGDYFFPVVSEQSFVLCDWLFSMF